MQQFLTPEEAVQRPELARGVARYGGGIAGPITVSTATPTVQTRHVGKRRRLRFKIRNTGVNDATFRAHASGISFESEEGFSAASDLTIAAGTESSATIEMPDGLLSEAGVSVIDQQPSDAGVTYPVVISIEDDDLGGTSIPILTDVATKESPAVWPSDKTPQDRLQRYLVTEVAGPSASLMHTLPSGLVGWPVSIRVDLSASALTSTLLVSGIPIGAGAEHFLSVLSVPILASGTPASLGPDYLFVTSGLVLTGPIPGSEGPVFSDITITRSSSDPYADVSNTSVVWVVRPA